MNRNQIIQRIFCHLILSKYAYLLFIVFPGFLLAQVTPQRNFLQQTAVKKPGVTSPVQLNALSYTEKLVQLQYLDGLGRIVQQNVSHNSVTGKDLVTPIEYDAYGREIRKWLPYTINGQGAFRTNVYNEQLQFYSPVSGDQSLAKDVQPYAQTLIEFSPLARVIEKGAQGADWQPGVDNRVVKQVYGFADEVDDVKVFRINYASGALPYIDNNVSYYDANTKESFLTKTSSIDEHGKTVIEYKDKENRVILKRVQIANNIQAFNTDGWLETYYIYDDFGFLRFVLSPKAVVSIRNAGWIVSEIVANELCFQYRYDHRGRMIEKKVPGAGWVYMVYDRRDRLAYTQDANMRNKNQWLGTVYDGQNRVIMTFMLNAALSREALESIINQRFDAQIVSSITVQQPIPGDLFISERNGAGNYTASSSITFNGSFLSNQNDEFVAEIGGGSITEQVSNFQFNPIPDGYTYVALTLHYFDHYQFTDKLYNPVFQNRLTAGTNMYPESLPASSGDQQLINCIGLPTGQKTRVLINPDNLGSGSMLESIQYYDEDGRVIQSQATNLYNGIDTKTNLYDFSGKLLSTIEAHQNPVAAKSLMLRTDLTHDAGDRVIAIKKHVYNSLSDAQPAISRDIAVQSYNEIGQLYNKDLGLSASTGMPLEQLQYNYTIRGWLSSINKDYLKLQGAAANWFGMELSYSRQTSVIDGHTVATYQQKQFNGNIGGTVWKSKGDGELRKYDYSYDAANRLLRADFTQFTGGAWNQSAGLNFNVLMGDGNNHHTAYDANGNILQMQQWGLRLNTSVQIDNLVYDYHNSGTSNKLKSVWDAVNDAQTKLGDFRTSATSPNAGAGSAAAKTDYNYDANGNMVLDYNKDISSIVYNHLNLPYQVSVNGKGTITYIYDAAGNKLEKRTAETSPTNKTTRTAYISGYVYQNDTLQFVGHEEGRIRQVNNNWVYDYFIKDHLGNVRMVLTEEQQTNAYPVASMETGNAASENLYYSNLDATRADKPIGYPNDSYTNPNNKVAKLDGNGNKIGPGILIKVMAGDSYHLRANSWYRTNGASPAGPASPINSIIAALANGVAGASGGKATAVQLQQGGVLDPAVTNFLNSQSYSSSKPKAFVNWLLLDEQLKYAGGGFEQVGDNEVFSTHIRNGLPVSKNGYLYVYVSNETPNIDVFFDNLQLTHVRGPLVEETHYYPFGLTMAGISGKTLNNLSLENKRKFNDGTELENKEFSDGSGLELYGTRLRSLDPQTGRWNQVDSKPDYAQGLYNSMGNNPILYNDPLGDTTKPGEVKTTLAVTFGLSLKVDFKLEGTPVKGGVELSTGEVDVVGFRDNDLKLGGYNFASKENEYQKGIGANLFGLGSSRNLTYAYKGNERGKLKNDTKEISAPFLSIEDSRDTKTGRSEKSKYVGIQFKLAFFVGIDFSIKVPISENVKQPKNNQTSERAQSDNTHNYVEKILLYSQSKKVKN